MAKTKKALYAGSFDPITLGHLDLIRRASRIFDELVVGVGYHPAKPPMFTSEERVELIRQSCQGMKNLEVTSFKGLAVDFALSINAPVLIRGLRSEVDFAYEMQMAMMNRALSKELDVIFILGEQRYNHITSSLVKEIAFHGRDVSDLIPDCVNKKLREKYDKA